jgi:hypothetical protein
MDQLKAAIGNRVELGTILGGDYAAAGGIYSVRGGDVADLKLTKIGAGGSVAEPESLGIGNLLWAPVLQGNLGQLATENEFKTGYLAGNRSDYDTKAVQAGVGARFYFNDHLSLAPTLSGIYGHTENDFKPGNANGETIANAAGSFVDWSVDTWSVAPGLDFRYDWFWGRTRFEFRSRYQFFHTESFNSSSEAVNVNGDSHDWENKIDVDVPLGWKLFGGEFHTGGFFSRTELFGDVTTGLEMSGFYTTNARFVWDPNGQLWVLRWIGLGVSYLWGHQFSGWSAGLDLSLRF